MGYNLEMKNILRAVSLPMWIFMLVSSVLFVIFPGVDLYVSGLFYNVQNDFYLNNSLFEHFFYFSVKPVLFGLLAGAIIVWLYNYFTKKTVLRFTGKKLIFILLVAGIGSGLIVNEMFKEHWGRARPGQVIEFGGDKTFTPAFIMSDQGGYSFSCGHGSGAFTLIGVALLFYRHRKIAMGVALSYGALVSLARIVGGGHFLSDTVTSFYVMWIVSHMLYYVMFERASKENNNKTADRLV